MQTAHPQQDSLNPKLTHEDTLLDRLFIWLFSRKMANAINTDIPSSGYSGFVELSQQIMQGRNGQQQQAVVARVLQSLVPTPVLWLIRTLFSPTRLVCVLNAWFAAQMFEWLVGPCEVESAEVVDEKGEVRSQPSAVQIQECRYLKESQCVGMCVNMCKLPTQTFFTEKFGIPLTMTPNFEDLSCTMVFGQPPIEPYLDEAFSEPCIEACSASQPTASTCPKLASSDRQTN